MKKLLCQFLLVSIALAIGVVFFLSCKTTKTTKENVYEQTYTPEESGLNLVRITDEGASVLSGSLRYGIPYKGKEWVRTGFFSGYYRDAVEYRDQNRINRIILRDFAVSPDGTELVYKTSYGDEKYGLCIRSTGAGSEVTQRSTKFATSVTWGMDDKLYFSYYMDDDKLSICSINSHTGSSMKQWTNNETDVNPVFSSDGKKLFFERRSGGERLNSVLYWRTSEATIWCYDMETSSMTMCCDGYCPYPVDKQGTTLLCCRMENDRYGIWLVNYEKGEETIVLSANDKDYMNPVLSPDGQWILCEGTDLSTENEKEQVDIFCVKMDGTNLTKLTSHPAFDLGPVWSPDGKYIYFVSSRGNKDEKFGIWRMDFNL